MVTATAETESVALTAQAVETWCDGVLAGTIAAGKLTRQAVERYRRDLATGHERGLWFDADAAQAVVDFFTFIQHFEGPLAGQPIVLEPWELFIVWNLFGWKRIDGTRRFRIGYVEVARKNGKSTFGAGIALYLLVGDGEPGPQIFSGATTKKQARDVLHGKAEKYVKHSPSLRKLLHHAKVTGALSCDANDGVFEPLGKDSDTQEGFNPHGAVLDELHAHPDRAVWDVIDSAIGAREQPLILAITTAGFDTASFCYSQRQYMVQILERVVDDDDTFCVIWSIDEDDDWNDEACWAKANPNLGVSVRVEDMRRMATKAKKRPTELNNFLTKKLNVWTSQKVAWTNMDVWQQSPPMVDEALLVGQSCYAGLDLSSNTDLTAFVLLFPQEDGQLIVLPQFWMPAKNIAEREHSDEVLYRRWVDEGYIVATEGNVIDYARIRADIMAACSRYEVVKLGFDRWMFEAIRQQLLEEGVPEELMVAYGQGFKDMSPAMKKVEELYLDRRLVGLNNPVLRWMASNMDAKTDPADNIKPDKTALRKSKQRIDGMIGLFIAAGLWSTDEVTARSVYEEENRGFRTL